MDDTIKKKILIWAKYPLLSRSGGPSTYLYNLKQHLNSSNYNIDYLPDFLFNGSNVNLESKLPYKKSFIKKTVNVIVPDFIIDFYRKQMSIKYALNPYLPDKLPLNIDLSDYYAIHFHSTMELVSAIPLLDKFDGVVILTSHTPCSPYQDNLNYLHLNSQNLKKSLFKKIVLKDFSAFERADILILPCKEAVSAYYDGYKPFADLKTTIAQKEVYYIPTGTPESKFNKSRLDIRKELSIPESAFVVHYAGRHKYEKGYDLLVDFGLRVMEKYDDVYFLITGRVNDEIPYPKNERWIEVGWTTDPFSYANACDLFALPNRITYFDLVLLEMLALGLPVMISNVGGNRYFEKHQDEMQLDFFNIDDIEEMVAVFSKIYLRKSTNWINKKIYLENYTDIVFANNYRKVYNLISEKYGTKRL